ncbi:MAG: hypothetical protein PHP42_04875 [Bacteroidota bacterium]|nr:hypothetical protein [Bacteroidota bacterium]
MNKQNNVESFHVPTVSAIAIVIYAFSNMLHEGAGHGLACVIVGGKPLALSSVYFDGDTTGLPEWTNRFIASAGTIVNFFAALIAFGISRTAKIQSPNIKFALILFTAVNLLQATGYFLFSGVAGIGDWAVVVNGLQYSWAWRIVLAIAGGLSYWWSVKFIFKSFDPFIGNDRTVRFQRAKTLAFISYFTGGILHFVSGILNPLGFMLVASSAIPATFGGTSGLLWGMQFLHNPKMVTTTTKPMGIAKNYAWMIAGGIVMLIFVFILGPSIKFR